MSARHLIIGLDGADLGLIKTLGPRHLPHIHALMAGGAFAAQESVQPPATLPNWTTYLTAVGPGQHGVFDFTTRRGYRVRFTGGTVRAVPTWASRLDALGQRCAVVGFPGTYPPERFRNGVFISGWDAPVAFEADASFIWPHSLRETLARKFGRMGFDEVDQFRADEPGWHAALGAKLAGKVVRRTELARFLLGMRRWDAFAFYFGESDTASHYLYSLFDEGSPRRPAQVSREEATGLIRVYEALDHAVAELVGAAGDGVEITLLSDHGFGGSSDRVLYLNRALAALGLLRFRALRSTSRLPAQLKQLALEGLPPRLREQAFRFGATLLPSLLESHVRFGSIDMAHTTAFSDELNYFPAVYLNVRGREPKGRIAKEERLRVAETVREQLLSLRDPDTQKRIVRRVFLREELFSGPFVERAPDLLLDLALLRGYSWNLMPSSAADPGTDFVARLTPREYLGKKGRSLPGSHRAAGFYLAAGPNVAARGQLDIGIEDAAVTTLARMGLLPPAESAGRVPAGLLSKAGRLPLPDARAPAVRSFGESSVVERLRALGYVD